MIQSEGGRDGGVSRGIRLRQAREAAGLAVADVAARLHIPRHVIEGLERDDTSALGAPVYVRGQVRAYARLLEVDLPPDADAAFAPQEIAPQPLVSHVHVPRYRRLMEQGMRRAVYIVLTAAIAVPVWLATRQHLDTDVTVQSLEPPAIAAPAPPQRPAARDAEPVIASIAPRPVAAPLDAALALRFNGDSWFEAVARDGRVLESAMVAAGETRRYPHGEVARVVIGNVAAVDARNSGESVDLAAFSRANVARFTLSSDGSLAPVSP